MGLTADPREISELTLQLTVDPSQLKLQKLTGKLGGGKFEVTGGAKLDHLVPTSLDLVLHTKQLPAVENPISVAVDSQITIHGERKNGALAGTIRVDSGSARLPTLTNVRDLQSTSELRDVVYVDERGRAAAVKRSGASRGPPLQITIETKLPGPFHVRSKELDVDLRGDLSATVHGSDFRLRGVVESLIGGHLEMFGKRYDIDHVRVSFDGGKTVNPFLDVKLTRQLIAALITIEVEGTAEKPTAPSLRAARDLQRQSDHPSHLGWRPGRRHDRSRARSKSDGRDLGARRRRDQRSARAAVAHRRHQDRCG